MCVKCGAKLDVWFNVMKCDPCLIKQLQEDESQILKEFDAKRQEILQAPSYLKMQKEYDARMALGEFTPTEGMMTTQEFNEIWNRS